MPDNIVITGNPGAELAAFLAKGEYSRIGILVDENTRRFCYPVLQKALPPHHTIVVPAGEEHKNLVTCQFIWQQLTDNGFDRHSVLIILGGGVAGDMGGFCAATFKRGIDFILIPTTLLAQVDASIGGKLGVDFNQLKNHIGVFRFPALTVLHAGFLHTLPERERRSGFAEIIKHALVSDVAVWQEISSRTIDDQDWPSLIRHSIDFKSKVVLEDPQEKGLRKVLNTGHTLGHALESYMLSKDKPVMHGEAIAAGIVAEGWIAAQRNLLSQADLDGLCHYIKQVFGKINWPSADDTMIVELMSQDKKNKGNKILCVLLDGLGKARWDCEISPDEVKGALSFYRSV